MDSQETPDAESLRLELQEALTTYRHWTTQAIQIAGIMITADALLITFGFSQRLAGVLFLASAMPISVVLVYVMIYSGTAPIIILAMRLERRLQFHGDSLAVTFARIHLKPLMAGRVSVETPDTEGLLNLDKNPSRRWLWQRVPIVLYAVTMIQIGLAILSLTVYHYRFM
jgi:hypothetical protein